MSVSIEKSGENMKVLIAIDSFKGSMSSLEAGEAAKKGLLRALPDAQVVVKAMADGGEGTYKTLLEALGGEEVSVQVKDPLGRETTAHYGVLKDGCAVIEMAQASGIALLSSSELDPFKATTTGFGQMILDAYERGAREFIIAIGGSATTEMGAGMLDALGVKLLDKDGREISPLAGELDFVESLDFSQVNPGLLDIKIDLACDVTNPLCGKNGAVAVFGPQKGVRRDQIELLDKKLGSFAEIINNYFGTDFSQAPGAGAAGGLGFTLMSVFKNLNVKSGAELVIEKLGIEEEIKTSDWVITGEGRIDNQTVSGKGPGMIALLGKKYGCRVVGFSGILNVPFDKCYELMDEIIQIKPEEMDLKLAMEPGQARENMTEALFNFCRARI